MADCESLWEKVKGAAVHLTPGFLVKAFASPYVAGATIESAIEKAVELYEKRKIISTIDCLGEEVEERAPAEEAVALYLEILRKLGEWRHSSVSIKPTQMGANIDPEFCCANVEKIVAAAEKANREITIDMESAELTDCTLDMHRELRSRYGNVGTVLQSRLYRTAEDVEKRLGPPGATVRLCIGIYNEPSEIAYTNKTEIKRNFIVVLNKLLDGGHRVQIATHDAALIRRCREIIEERKIAGENVEFQMLLGVPIDSVQDELVRAGYTVRSYIPFAVNWDDAIAYCKRRMKENPGMALYVIKNLLGKIK